MMGSSQRDHDPPGNDGVMATDESFQASGFMLRC